MDEAACVATYHPASIIVCSRGCLHASILPCIYHCVWTRLPVSPLTTLHLSLCVDEAACMSPCIYHCVWMRLPVSPFTTLHIFYTRLCGHLPPCIYHCVWTRLPLSLYTTLHLLCEDEAACIPTYHPASIV